MDARTPLLAGECPRTRARIERAVILAHGASLPLEDGLPTRRHTETLTGAPLTLAAVERQRIVRVLQAADWTIEGPGARPAVGPPSQHAQLGITRPPPRGYTRQPHDRPREVTAPRESRVFHPSSRSSTASTPVSRPYRRMVCILRYRTVVRRRRDDISTPVNYFRHRPTPLGSSRRSQTSRRAWNH